MYRILTVCLAALALACGGSGGSSNTTPAQVATPVFSPAAGTYTSSQSVTLSCATAGATIHFTTDGSTPTAASATYAGALAITSTTTVKAMATAAGLNDSAVATATYTITVPTVATPTFSPAPGTYTQAQSVTISTATAGAAIHYTTDGSTPTAGSTAYTTPVAVTTGTVTLKAVAVKAGSLDSAVATGAYTINPAAQQAAAPTFSPAGGTFTSVQSVTLSSTTPNAVIHYTLDGTTPTVASATYATALSVATTTTIKAIATATGFTPSDVAQATYTIDLPTVATPTFSPAAGTYSSAQNVTIATATAGATIHYTADGSTPTEASPTYGAPVAITTGTVTLKAFAVKTGSNPSAVASASYTIQSGGGITFDQVCTQAAAAFRTMELDCFKMNPDLFPIVSDCAPVAKEIAAGRVTYDAAQAQACLDALGGLAACTNLSAGQPSACAAVLTPQVSPGGTCYLDDDCIGGFCDVTTCSATHHGTCVSYRTAGQTCSLGSQLCAPGLDCAGGTCLALAGLGQSCAAVSCQDAYYCDATRTCRAPLASGATCTALDACSFGLACLGTTTTTCQPVSGQGGTCATFGQDQCGLGWICSANQCVAPPVAGQPCDPNQFLCQSAYCDLTDLQHPTCRAFKADGQPCTLDFQCASGVCDASLANPICVAAICPAP